MLRLARKRLGERGYCFAVVIDLLLDLSALQVQVPGVGTCAGNSDGIVEGSPCLVVPPQCV